MTLEHPHAAVARAIWDAIARGDREALLGLYAPDAVLRVHGDNPLAGEYKGVDSVLAGMARPAELVDDMRSELLDVYAGDTGAVIRYRVTAERGEAQLDQVYLTVVDIRDGRVTRATSLATDQLRTDAFWRGI
jgi:ketosteroid isomerase-like protein